MAKGQYFGLDAIVGAIIFILSLSAFFGYWLALKHAFSPEHAFLLHQGIVLSDNLFLFFSRNHVFSAQTLENLSTLDADKLQSILDSPVPFIIRIAGQGKCGFSYTLNATFGHRTVVEQVSVTRVGIVENATCREWALINVTVYRYG